MTRFITIILSAVFALSVTTAGATSDMQTVGFVNASTGTIIVMGMMPTESASDAKFMVHMTDDTLIEESFGVVVVEAIELDRVQLRGLNASAGSMYATVDTDFMPGLIIVAASKSDVFILAMMGNDLDGELFAEVTRDAIANRLDIDAPRGYIDVPMDDNAPIESLI